MNKAKRHSDNLCCSLLHERVELPTQKEPKLEILGKAFEWLIQEAQYTAVRDIVGLFMFFQGNVKESGKLASMPFNN